jgi:hypothetical protein
MFVILSEVFPPVVLPISKFSVQCTAACLLNFLLFFSHCLVCQENHVRRDSIAAPLL